MPPWFIRMHTRPFVEARPSSLRYHFCGRNDRAHKRRLPCTQLRPDKIKAKLSSAWQTVRETQTWFVFRCSSHRQLYASETERPLCSQRASTELHSLTVQWSERAINKWLGCQQDNSPMTVPYKYCWLCAYQDEIMSAVALVTLTASTNGWFPGSPRGNRNWTPPTGVSQLLDKVKINHKVVKARGQFLAEYTPDAMLARPDACSGKAKPPPVNASSHTIALESMTAADLLHNVRCWKCSPDKFTRDLVSM
jgi:hypothetical protein